MKQQKKLIVLLAPLVIVAVSISLSFIHFLEQQAIKSLILFIVFSLAFRLKLIYKYRGLLKEVAIKA